MKNINSCACQHAAKSTPAREATYQPVAEVPNVSDRTWMGMTALYKGADSFLPKALSGPSRTSAVVRISLKDPVSPGLIRLLSGKTAPRIRKQSPTGVSTPPYILLGNATRQPPAGILLVPKPGSRQVDLVFFPRPDQSGTASAWTHPERRLIGWMKARQQSGPQWVGGITRINVLLRRQPCNSCIKAFSQELRRYLPATATLKVRWMERKVQVAPNAAQSRSPLPVNPTKSSVAAPALREIFQELGM